MSPWWLLTLTLTPTTGCQPLCGGVTPVPHSILSCCTKATEYNPHLLPPWWQRHAMHHKASVLHRCPSFPINMKSWSMPCTVTLLLCTDAPCFPSLWRLFCVNTSASVYVSPPSSSRFSHSLRNTDCFHWRIILEINIYTLYRLKATGESWQLSHLRWQVNRYMCAYWPWCISVFLDAAISI